jgi:hypothetical protein
MPQLIGRCGGGCAGIIDSTATAGDECGVHSVGAAVGSVLTSDGVGGSVWSAGGALEEHIIAASVNIAAGTSHTFDFAHYDGNIILDLSTAGKAIALTDGVYAAGFGVNFSGGIAGSAGSQVDVSLGVVQAQFAWPPGYTVPGTTSAVQPNNALASFDVSGAIPVSKMVAGDFWGLHVFNGGTHAYDVQGTVSIVKLA